MNKPNRLAKELSPYLLQHAYNPVDWYPWGEEAINKARAENKPIFLSIGYASCHWCHVMEKESFEDEYIAKLLNEYFVPVKVDREERPDLDEIYMKAVMLISGSGGWPLTVFLTPSLKPFFGGTYFPPRRRVGMVGLDEILTSIIEVWRSNPEDIEKNAEQITSILKNMYVKKQAEDEISYDVVYRCFESLVSNFDEVYGGFGAAPKFPMPNYIEFLHMFYKLENIPLAYNMARVTLEKMAKGGIRDQLGGGFHRYSIDRFWTIPHFEKMLYDNALLSRVYLQSYQISGNPFMKKISTSTLDWMISEMLSPEGGFYSSVDADSSEGEGIFYTWTKREVLDILGVELGEIFCKAFGISDVGNFEHDRSVPTLSMDSYSLASYFSMKIEDIEEKLELCSRALLDARGKRPKPAVDDKIIASWNGLAISALSLGYQVTGEEKYLRTALSVADFIYDKLWRDGYMYRFYRNGIVRTEGFLEDYSYFASGLLDLFESTFDPRLLRRAITIADSMIDNFWDKEEGGFFFSMDDVGDISRIKDAHDGVTPSGNSMAAHVLLRLYEITGVEKYREFSEKTLKTFYNDISESPVDYTFMLQVLAAYFGMRREIVVVGEIVDAKPFLDIIYQTYMPFRTIICVGSWNREELEELSQVVVGKIELEERTTVYLCENYSCKKPVTTLEELKKLIT
ncbi:MAG: thioredoxin domain-containing protein [Nitrososphaeria archaeon]|nr:thioredoxin domain-containing protein [Nitrososphaeria archaeon]